MIETAHRQALSLQSDVTQALLKRSGGEPLPLSTYDVVESAPPRHVVAEGAHGDPRALEAVKAAVVAVAEAHGPGAVVFLESLSRCLDGRYASTPVATFLTTVAPQLGWLLVDPGIEQMHPAPVALASDRGASRERLLSRVAQYQINELASLSIDRFDRRPPSFLRNSLSSVAAMLGVVNERGKPDVKELWRIVGAERRRVDAFADDELKVAEEEEGAKGDDLLFTQATNELARPQVARLFGTHAGKAVIWVSGAGHSELALTPPLDVEVDTSVEGRDPTEDSTAGGSGAASWFARKRA